MAAGIQANAQGNVAKLNMLSVLLKTANISYEKVINEEKSIQIGISYTNGINDGKEFKGIQLTPEYRFYLSETDAPEGVFIAPHIRYSNHNAKDNITGEKADVLSFGGGIVIGKQWIFKEIISLEAFLGPAYSIASVETEGQVEEFSLYPLDGFSLRSGIKFGFVF
jgi:hypothetical protein